VGSLCGILRRFGLWRPIADRVQALPERHMASEAESSPLYAPNKWVPARLLMKLPLRLALAEWEKSIVLAFR